MRGAFLHALACAAALAVPWLTPGSAPVRDAPPAWPDRFEGAPLRPVELRPGELSRDFPGHAAKFTDGRRTVIVRLIERDTRRVHPPEECMKAIGYDVQRLAPRRDEQ